MSDKTDVNPPIGEASAGAKGALAAASMPDAAASDRGDLADPIGDTVPSLLGSALLEPRTDADFFTAEGESRAASDPGRAAESLYQAGHILETNLRENKEAAQLYTRALTLDPSHRPTLWALRRFHRERRRWDNLVRIYDAEARFAVFPRPADRADQLCERGRLLAELSRHEAAGDSFREAVTVDPTHARARVSLLVACLLRAHELDGRGPTAEQAAVLNEAADCLRALGALGAAAMVPVGSARAFAVEAARALRRVGSFRDGRGVNLDREGAPAFAGPIEVLIAALDTGAVADPAVGLLDEIERLSALANDVNLRLAALQAVERALQVAAGAPATGPARSAAVLREQATLLARQDHPEAALAAYRRALALVPDHPLVLADLLDLDLAASGGPSLFGVTTEAGALPGRETRLLASAERALRAGQAADVSGLLAGIDERGPWGETGYLVKLRAAAQRPDPVGLAQLFEAEGERLLASVAETPGVAPAAPAAWGEAAHLLVRAATLREVSLGDGPGAEAQYQRALSLRPGYRPAIEGLASLFTREGRWDELVELVAADARNLAPGAQAAAVRESLVLLDRDVLHDFQTALSIQREIVNRGRGSRTEVGAPEGVDTPGPELATRNLFRWADAAALAAAGDRAAVGDALLAFDGLLSRVAHPGVRAALALAGARLCARARRDADEVAWLNRALASDPRSGAAAAIEHAPGADPAVRLVALERELEAWERTGGGEKPRTGALRFRLAFARLGRGEVAEALSALAALDGATRPAARIWMRDIARQSSDPSAMLLAAGIAPHEVMVGDKIDVAALAARAVERSESDAETWLALGEVLERAGRRSEADVAFSAAERRATHEWESLASAFARLRCADRPLGPAAPLPTVGGAVGGATVQQVTAALLDGPIGRSLSDASSDRAGRAVLAWLLPRAGTDPVERWRSLCNLAVAAGRGPVARDLWFGVAARGAFLENLAPRDVVDHADAFSRAELADADEGIAAPVGWRAALRVAATDGHGAPAALRAQLRDERLTLLAADSAGDGADGLAFSLLLDAVAQAQAEHRVGDAAAYLLRALRMVPQSRTARMAACNLIRGLPTTSAAERARATVSLARGLTTPQHAAHFFNQAGADFEAASAQDEAIACYQRALVAAPDDESAFARLCALLRERLSVGADPGTADAAQRLVALIGWRLSRLRAVNRPEDSAARVALLIERGRLRMAVATTRAAGLDDCKRALQLDAKNFEALALLGAEALARGNPTAAVDFLGRAHQALAPDAPAPVRARSLVALAEAQEAAEDQSGAARSSAQSETPSVRGLREAHALCLDDAPLLDRLIGLLSRRGRHAEAAEVLRAAIGRQEISAALGGEPGPAQRAAQWLRVARIARDHLQDREQTAAALWRALALDPSGEVTGELTSEFAGADVPPTERPALLAACQRLLGDLRSNPVDVARLDTLAALSRLGRESVRATACEQLLGLLERVPTATAQATLPLTVRLGREDLLRLAPGAPAGSAEAPPDNRVLWSVWPLVAPAFARAVDEQRGVKRTAAGREIVGGSEPRLAFVEALGAQLGRLDLRHRWLGPGETWAGGVVAASAAGPGLLFDPAALAGDSATRFRIAEALVLVALDLGFLARPGRPADPDVGAWPGMIAALAGHPRAPAEGPGQDFFKRVDKALGRRERKALANHRQALSGALPDGAAWLAEARQIARRLALIASGDLGAAVQVVAGFDPIAIGQSLAAIDLIAFALGDGLKAFLRAHGAGGEA